ncbi:hypothetical protein Cni_G01399 [Canna indica]|uniref:Uncharacterized protein n=1 Tax=Canna indica TaxID=4628 RepID=A0AAQ3PYL6_9LILI|nr:hypothetical protein Cni_G01399 [Canna indica]
MASSFPHLSDSDEDALSTAVDAVIAEASDLCALEQIAALNTAHLSDSNLLPSNLESRFRKLKSLPASLPKPSATASPPRSQEKDMEKENFPDDLKLNRARTMPNPAAAVDPLKPEEPIPVREGRKAEIFPLESEGTPRTKEPKSKSGFVSSPSFSANSSRGSSPSPSPPRQRCCLSFSPKRPPRRKAKGDDVLAELGVRSLKEEQRKLKKALKEQEKVMREADKMVKWVKQASARMNAAAIDELMNDVDDEELK